MLDHTQSRYPGYGTGKYSYDAIASPITLQQGLTC